MEQQAKAVKRSVIPDPVRAAGSGPGAGTAAPTTNSKRPSASAAEKAGKAARVGGVGSVGNIYQPECPAQRALETIASKWAILVLHSLLEGPLRFNALQRRLNGISQKVLTEQLRRLERFGIVSRAVHPTVPPSVEYSLTPAGRELKGALGVLCEWSNKHAAILLAGEASDAQARGAAKTRKLSRAGGGGVGGSRTDAAR